MNFKLLVGAIFLSLFLVQCKSKQSVQKLDEQHYVINTNTIDSSIYYKILPYKKEMDSKMNTVVGVTEQALNKEQPEGLLGNFVCDLLYKQSKIYLGKDSTLISTVVLNNGGLRTSLPKGDITIGKIFELMPFDNELTLVEISGDKAIQMMDFLAEKGGMPVSGITMKIDNAKPIDAKINGKAIDTNQHYYIISSDYLANGGDKMDFFKNPISIKPLKILLRDAIIDYCKKETAKGKTLNATLDGRISTTK